LAPMTLYEKKGVKKRNQHGLARRGPREGVREEVVRRRAIGKKRAADMGKQPSIGKKEGAGSTREEKGGGKEICGEGGGVWPGEMERSNIPGK